MPQPLINRTVLMSGADFFDNTDINSHSHGQPAVDRARAMSDFANIRTLVQASGIRVIKIPPPPDCPDGIFTANWGLARAGTTVLSSLPPQRAAEQPYARSVLTSLGQRVIDSPYRFSGQGDALPCGNLLFCGTTYRTDPRMHQFLADELGFEVIRLQAVPELDPAGRPVINPSSGWPDSFFYDIDLAISILSPNLIAWCPEAFTPESQGKIRALANLEKIKVSRDEAINNFACNLISTGTHVVMGSHAPKLRAAIEAHGLTVTTADVRELTKGGGFIRCTTLTLGDA